MLRSILHCDMNNFYASVECMLDPALKKYPIAVCGSVEERHGIVLAKNYKAMYLFSLGEKIECLNKIYYPSVYKRFDALADFLGCSKKALAIRMKQLGLLKKEYLDNPFDLVTVYPEVSEL